MDGFTYNGIHSSIFHCYYIPKEAELFDRQPDYEIYDSSPAWQDGGQYYGSKVKQRTFTLSCFFDDVTLETKEKMIQWLDRKTNGELIFDERPFVSYEVFPTKKQNGKIYRHFDSVYGQFLYSGTFTITFTAYNPFGLLKQKYYETMDYDGVSQYCGILEKNEMPPGPSVSIDNFLVYNCGTERCGCVIRIGGSAPNGLTITNYANGNVCKLLSLPTSPAYLEIDSSKGTINVIEGNANTSAFEYSDEGYIVLEPCGVVVDEEIIEYTSGSDLVTPINKLPSKKNIGKYIRVANKWHRIIGTSGASYSINGEPLFSGTEKVKFVTVNNLVVSGDGYSLDKIEIDYRPMIL